MLLVTTTMDSLKNLCAKAVAKYIGNNVLPYFTLRDAKLSNLIFKSYLQLDPSDHRYHSFLRFCINVEAVEHNSDELTDFDRAITFNMILESLSLLKMDKWKNFHSKKFNLPEDSDQYVMYLKPTLTKLLSPQSQNKLKSLTLMGKKMVFEKGWVHKLFALLPSLKELNIEWYKIPNHVFKDEICVFLQNLTRLDIKYSRLLTSLTGISALRALKYLDITGIDFEKKEDMEELFQCETLETLIACGVDDEKSDFMIFYTQCKKGLPNLKILFCTFNELNVDELCHVVQTSEKLETICVVGTDLDDFPALHTPDEPPLNILSCRNIAGCMEALEFHLQYRSRGAKHTLQHICRRIFEIYQKLDGSEGVPVQKLLHFMCKNIERLEHGALNVIDLICSNHINFAFEKRDVKCVHHTILNMENILSIDENLSEQAELQRKFACKILSNRNLAEICSEFKFVILQRAVPVMVKVKGDPELTLWCWRMFMNGADENRPPGANDENLYKSGLFSLILQNLEHVKFSEQDDANMIKFLDLIRVVCDPERYEIDRTDYMTHEVNTTRSLYRLIIDKYKDNGDMILMIQQTINGIHALQYKHTVVIPMEIDVFAGLVNLLACSNIPARTFGSAVLLLLGFHRRFWGPDGPGPDGTFHTMGDDLIQAMKGYKPTEHTEYLEILSWILTHCRRRDTEIMVTKYFEQYLKLERLLEQEEMEKGVEPEPKQEVLEKEPERKKKTDKRLLEPVVEPVEPVEPPLEPMKLTEPTKPVKPVKPVEPTELVEPEEKKMTKKERMKEKKKELKKKEKEEKNI